MVFDLGGVLIRWDPRNLYRKIFDDEEEMERFLSGIATAEWNDRQDRGRPFAEGVEDLSAQHPAYAAEIAAFRDRWEEMLDGLVPGTEEIVDELLAARVPTYALSNWSAETFPRARDRFPVLDRLDGIVVSGEVGIAKPDPEVFELFVERFALDRRRTLIVDDNEANVRAAEAFGFATIRFTTADALRERLVAEGLLAEARR